MSLNPNIIADRRHELDWLRVFAVLMLVFFHTGLIFNTWKWHIKNPETNENFAYWMAFLHTWRMPLLFFISGAGTYFAFGKLSAPQFFVERVRRLIVPLIFGTIVIVPPQPYFEHFQEFDNYFDFYKSVLHYVPYYQGSPNLYHLWFLGHLFMYSVIGIPIIIFLRSTYCLAIKTWFLNFFFKPVILLLLPPILILATQLLFIPQHPGRAHFAFYFSFFLAGIICYSSPDRCLTIGKNRMLFLIASVLSLVPHVIWYRMKEGIYPFETYDNYSLLEVMSIFVSWFLVLTLIAYGQYYLMRPRTWLSRVGEGTYPFYILHQTVIVILGYYLCRLPWGINTKFWTISLLTIVICALIFELLIRPFNVMRFLFGLRLTKTKKDID